MYNYGSWIFFLDPLVLHTSYISANTEIIGLPNWEGGFLNKKPKYLILSLFGFILSFTFHLSFSKLLPKERSELSVTSIVEANGIGDSSLDPERCVCVSIQTNSTR